MSLLEKTILIRMRYHSFFPSRVHTNTFSSVYTATEMQYSITSLPTGTLSVLRGSNPTHSSSLFVRLLPPAHSCRALLIQSLGVGLRGPTLILGDTHLPETQLPSAVTTLLSGACLAEANLGAEFLALPGPVDHFVELVDLLEGEALGLVDHEPDEDESDRTEGSPDEEHLGLQIRVFRVNEVGG